MSNIATAWNFVLSGKYLEGVTYVFTGLIDYWFYALMLLLTLIIVYNKTQDVGSVAVVGIIIGAIMRAFLPPNAHIVAYFAIALSIAIILAKLYKSDW